MQRSAQSTRGKVGAGPAPVPSQTPRPWPIQARLEVGATSDRLEQEADRIADRVAGQGPPGANDEGSCGCGGSCGACGGGATDGGPVARRSTLPDGAASIVSRDDEEELRAQRDGDTGAGASFTASPSAEGDIARLRGGGQPLDDRTRVSLQERFGHDFARVRVHAGDPAGDLAHELGARAFTVGNDVFFGRGRYQPGSSEGLWLLSHELAHVVQQGGGGPLARVQRNEADTQTQCPTYVRWDRSQALDHYNCAGLAFRTYTYRGNIDAERTAAAAGTSVACGTACPHGQVKHWFWEYDMGGEVPDLGVTQPISSASHDFHTVAGVSTRAGADPDDVYSKNGQRPVHGPGTGASHRPPAREPDTNNDPQETPNLYQGKRVYKLRGNFQERCTCFSCTATPSAPAPPPPASPPKVQKLSETASGPHAERAGSDEDGSWTAPTLSAASLGIRRAASDGSAAPSPTAAGGLIVEDGQPLLAPGEMNRGPFFERLKAAICMTAQTEMERIGQTAEGCPFLTRWIAKYERRSAAELERAMRIYAPESASVASAEDYIGFVTARLAHGIANWARTGSLPSDLPEEAREDLNPGGVAGALASIGQAVSGFFSSLGALFKAGPGGVRTGVDAGALAQRLGPGLPLDATPRDRMEGVLGARFSNVRLHTDQRAAAAARSLNATAFTVGPHIAFSAGAYRPGQPDGDALLAHELAHVAQQGDGAAASSLGLVPGRALPVDDATEPAEREADGAAQDALQHLWGHRFPREARQLGPRDPEERQRERRGRGRGLRVQLNRCGGAQTAPPQTAATQAPPEYRADAPLTLSDAQARRTELMTQNPIPAATAAPAAAAGTQTLHAAVTGLLTPQQFQPGQLDAAWLGVQRSLATAWGQVSDDLSAVQRTVTDMLEVAERLDGLGSAAEANSLRTHARDYLFARIPQIVAQLPDRVVTTAMPALRAIGPALSASTETSLRAAVASAVTVPAFQFSDLMASFQFIPSNSTTAQFRDQSRRAVLGSMSTYRDTVRHALEGASETTFGALYSANATGIHQETLIAADLQSRMASAPTTASAGHLQFSAASAQLLQQTLEQIYKLQATSPIGYRLVSGLIAGTAGGRTQNRDISVNAVGSDVPQVLGDSFATSRVDPAEFASMAANPQPGLPNNQGASYAHFLSERQYDAINATADWAPVAAAAEAVQADAVALIARTDCPPALRSFLMSGPPPAGQPGPTDADFSWAESVRPGFRAHGQTLTQLVSARFLAAHNAAVGLEYNYYREQGLEPPSRGVTTQQIQIP